MHPAAFLPRHDLAAAAVHLLPSRYQRRRMYTRIALGKNSAMDVVSGESSGTSGQLRLLYPMLFGASNDSVNGIPGVGYQHAAAANVTFQYSTYGNTSADVKFQRVACGNNAFFSCHHPLAGLQIWQFLLGADVMHQAYGAVFYPEQWLAVAAPDADLRAARGIFLAGCLFAAMAVMNMVNTTATIREKSSYRRRAKAKAA